MKNPLNLLVLLCAIAFTACKSKDSYEPELVPADGLRHEILTVLEDSIFCNPERGFHRYFDMHSPNPTQLLPVRVNGIYNEGFSLILTNYFLEEYMDGPIADSYLDIVRNNLQAIREGGCKNIIRFAYTNSEKVEPHEASKEIILQHIEQIKPILQEYADVIFVMEAGFIGTWGEWYYTTHFTQNPQTDEEFAERRPILDALLDAMPKERMICVRTPKFKMRCYGWTLADTLTRAEAFTNTPKARLACHDDAFMADQTDMGTFNTVDQRKYWEAETKYLIYGGESCPPGNVAGCTKTTEQMLNMHISYLNYDYYKGTISKWRNNGCLNTFKQLIGYRFEGREVTTTYKPKAGEELKVKLSLVNVGYSAPKNPRDIEMILVNTNDATDRYTVVPNSDPRFWFTDEMVYVEAAFVPKKAGKYKIYLNLPDPQPNLRNNPRYSIRLANKDMWDEATGYNYLTTVTVE